MCEYFNESLYIGRTAIHTIKKNYSKNINMLIIFF